jgi:hypothetical protein
MSAIYLNPNDFYKQEMDSWEEFWNDELSLYENVSHILSQAILLPQKDLMIPIVATYILIPSKWARILPILFSWGGKGSGKSTTAIFAAKLHGIDYTFSATDTFSAIRNALDSMRWLQADEDEEKLEQEGAILPWDNIHAGTFKKDERIYQMMLFGYSRASDRISIAQPDGTNREFHVFSPKIISSIDDLHINPDFEELHRRLIVIPHKSFDEFTAEEKRQYEYFDIHTDRIDLDSIHWDGIENKFFGFWNNPDNCKLYAKYRTILTKKGKKDFKHNMKSEQWIISVDLIVTGLIVGTWKSIPEAINHMDEYWNFANNNIFNQLSATIEHLETFINDEIGEQKKLNSQVEEAGRKGMNLVIAPQKLKTRLAFHHSRGELDIIPNQKEVINLMSRLGWRLTSKGWVEKQ